MFRAITAAIGSSWSSMRAVGVAGALLVATALPAQAAMVTYLLDQSNENVALPDGTAYLQVDIAEEGADDFKFTVTVLPPLLSSAGPNFGIQSFGFNSTTLLNPAEIPVGNFDLQGIGWSVSTDTQRDGFGTFDYVVDGLGNNRQSPLVFYLRGVGGGLGIFATASGDPAAEGNTFFVAHVADFNVNGVESAFFGGSTLVPLPASIWLFLSGIGALRLSRGRWLGRRQAAT